MSHDATLFPPPPKPTIAWWRTHGFLLGLGVAVLLGFVLPAPGARGGVLHAGLVTNFGIALILFLQGLSLALEQIRSGAANWRLHLVIQGFTFVVFPVVGVVMNWASPWYWPDCPQAIRDGFLYLCVLPSTISSSVVLTAVAGGNTPGALFNAAFSNILGVMVTPVLVHFLMQKTGQSAPFLPLLMKIMLLTLLPFGLGMALRPFLKRWVDEQKVGVARISNFVILFIVYAAFCDSVVDRVWERHGWGLTVGACLETTALFTLVSILTWMSCKALRLARPDLIAAYFCSVKKTLAMGVPLAILIFGEREDLPLILLPVMLYHPLQLLANGVLASYWAKEAA